MRDEKLEQHRQTNDARLNQLRALGYAGGRDVDELIKPLNEFFRDNDGYSWDNFPWWVHMKNDPSNIGTDFLNLITDNLSTLLTSNKPRWRRKNN